MLKLLPEQVSRHWDIIRFALEETAGPGQEVDENLAIIYAEKMIAGQVQCWVVYEKDKFPEGVLAMVFTSIIKDAITEKKNVHIIGIYIFDRRAATDKSIWKRSLITLVKFGKGNSCSGVTFFTNVPELLRMAKEIGMTLDFTYGIFSIT